MSQSLWFAPSGISSFAQIALAHRKLLEGGGNSHVPLIFNLERQRVEITCPGVRHAGSCSPGILLGREGKGKEKENASWPWLMAFLAAQTAGRRRTC